MKYCRRGLSLPKCSGRSGQWIPEGIWKQVRIHIPIPCVDVIVENAKGEFLLGWRCIQPYRNVWALPGGRLLKGEPLQHAVSRILAEYSLRASDLYLVGAFPIRFPGRSDVPICIAAKHKGGTAEPDGNEFSRFLWTKKPPSRLGKNYGRMIAKWLRIRKLPNTRLVNKISQ
jgi:ADP-ribose pyrophosphatase YjhB (NUDIX family)